MAKLARVEEQGWVGGICAGVAYWLAVPVWMIRLGVAVSVFGYGTGLGLYLLLWFLMPSHPGTPADYAERADD